MRLKQTLLTIVLSLCMVAASLPNIVSADVKPQDRWTDYAAASFDGGWVPKPTLTRLRQRSSLHCLPRKLTAE